MHDLFYIMLGYNSVPMKSTLRKKVSSHIVLALACNSQTNCEFSIGPAGAVATVLQR